MECLTDFMRRVAKALPPSPSEPEGAAVVSLMRHAVTSSGLTRDLAATMVAVANEPARLRKALLEHAERPVALTAFVWPPGATSGTHRHLDWTSTGIVRGGLTVETFDDALAPHARFRGTAGDAGFLSAPCTHHVSNPEANWTVSLHLFGGPRVVDESGQAGRGRVVQITPASVASYTIPERLLIGAAELAFGLDDESARSLLVRIASVSPPRAALHAIQKLRHSEPRLAGELALGIASRLSGADAARVRGLGAILLRDT